MSRYLRTGSRRNARISVTVMPSGKTVEMISGASLLEALSQASDKVAFRCGGRPLCGACHVIVLQGGRGLSKVRREERERLAQINGTDALSRLSCQALLGVHEVTVELVNH